MGSDTDPKNGETFLMTMQVVEKGMEMLRRHIGIPDLDEDTSA